MEIILKGTDIFDKEIDEKFRQAIQSFGDKLNKDNVYKFIVSFHVNLLNDSRFGEFDLPVTSKKNTGTKKDRIYEVLSFQLDKLVQILEVNDLEAYSTIIQGDKLEEVNMLKIELVEDESPEKNSSGKGKKNKRPRVSSIIPSMPFTTSNVTSFASERISKIFNELMNIINNKKIMSEILDIDETDDESLLFKAFSNQYGELWLTTSEKEKELLNQFKERCEMVLNRYEKDKGI
jgi:hypothetical protein